MEALYMGQESIARQRYQGAQTRKDSQNKISSWSKEIIQGEVMIGNIIEEIQENPEIF